MKEMGLDEEIAMKVFYCNIKLINTPTNTSLSVWRTLSHSFYCGQYDHNAYMLEALEAFPACLPSQTSVPDCKWDATIERQAKISGIR
jgi:hypothetical protein